MTQHVVVLLNMNMESTKSDVNGRKKKVRFWHIKKKVTSTKMIFLKRIDPNCIEINFSFKKLKICFCHIRSYFNPLC